MHDRAIAACEECKRESVDIAISVGVAVVTSLTFYRKTNARLNDQDSNCTKFMACFAAFVGGVNFLVAVLSYWDSCVTAIDQLPKAEAKQGVGLICILISAVLKVLMGIVHIGLPVHHPEEKNHEV
mmetsp:Transcript_149683/g.480603  ORF Transcript_149683/g.480603 Transcript_149683/m.480603 type:complete len:126 (-) Transcript_149683:105-482(-)